jgi:hypothetical protein
MSGQFKTKEAEMAVKDAEAAYAEMRLSAWREYESDFNCMTDEEIERELDWSLHEIDTHESWVEAVMAWKQAGKPRRQENQDA